MDNRLHFSSESDEWETPQDLFDELNKEFSFTLDVCATAENCKVPIFFSLANSALDHLWTGVCWCNPPYSKPEKACKYSCAKKTCQKRGFHLKEDKPGAIDWVRKAYESSLQGATVVMLLPARTDVKYFHKYIWDKELNRPRDGVELRFLEGRLKFGDSEDAAPFPSMIVVFRPYG